MPMGCRFWPGWGDLVGFGGCHVVVNGKASTKAVQTCGEWGFGWIWMDLEDHPKVDQWVS